ncbi:cell division protein FtsA [Patescibacteria group bacterium]|nr:MAG: cell division protein FtsA [Patescibacteria group bacterium]
MARPIATGIDIGSYQIKIVVAQHLSGNDKSLPTILGTGFAESRGLRHGYIVNIPEVTKSLKVALAQAEKSSGTSIRRAYLGVGGIGLSGITGSGSVIITRADSEITELDTLKALEAAEQDIPPVFIQNRRVIASIPIQYKIDSKPILGTRPMGMKGSKLEVRALFITSLEHHLKDLVEAVEEAGVEVVDVLAAPIAASFVTLTKTQKVAGCVLANIGSETLSIVVFENNIPVSLEIFPIGSTDITNDIALGLRISLEEAESIKLGGVTTTEYPRKKLEEIVGARLSDMFELIEAHLKKIGRNGLLPAGIVITGGGSSISMVEDFAKASLKLPSRIAHINFPEKEKGKIKDAFFAVALGLCIIGLSDEDNGRTVGKLMRSHRSVFGPVKEWVRQFLP